MRFKVEGEPVQGRKCACSTHKDGLITNLRNLLALPHPDSVESVNLHNPVTGIEFCDVAIVDIVIP